MAGGLTTFTYTPGNGRTIGDGSSQVITFDVYGPYFIAELWGCMGSGTYLAGFGRNPGRGTRLKAKIPMPPGPTTVELRCGGRAYAGDNFSGSITAFDGYNGGGFHANVRYNHGSGGGMTDVRPVGGGVLDCWLIAPGGGASSDWGDGLYNSSYPGGDAGGAVGSDSPNFGFGVAGGGTQTAGGVGTPGGSGLANPGSLGLGGNGIGNATGGGGGGGGGYYGGAGGKGWDGHGGGGGSWFIHPNATDVEYDIGTWTGNGQAVIQRFTTPQGGWHVGSINWSATW